MGMFDAFVPFASHQQAGLNGERFVFYVMFVKCFAAYPPAV